MGPPRAHSESGTRPLLPEARQMSLCLRASGPLPLEPPNGPSKRQETKPWCPSSPQSACRAQACTCWTLKNTPTPKYISGKMQKQPMLWIKICKNAQGLRSGSPAACCMPFVSAPGNTSIQSQNASSTALSQSHRALESKLSARREGASHMRWELLVLRP